MTIVPYALLSVLAVIFSWWFWQWGVNQPAVKSIEEVPGIFNASNIIASILFFGSSWFVIRKHLKNSFRVLVGLVVWYVTVVFLGRVGFFAMRPLFAPNLTFAFIILILAIKKLLTLPALQSAFQNANLSWVMSVQVFRVMGVGFLSLYAMKVLPGEFAIPTGIGDIVVGTTAPLVAYIYSLKKSYSTSIAIFWNYLGIADLVMAISLGILTYPEPLHVVPTQVSNLPIALYPLVIIPVFAVPLSVMLHLFSLQVLHKIIKE